MIKKQKWKITIEVIERANPDAGEELFTEEEMNSGEIAKDICAAIEDWGLEVPNYKAEIVKEE